MKFKKPSINIVQNKRHLFCQHTSENEAPQGVSAIEQYEKMKHLPTGKGRRIAKIPRLFS